MSRVKTSKSNTVYPKTGIKLSKSKRRNRQVSKRWLFDSTIISKQKRNRLMEIGKKVQLILKEIKAKIKSANKEEDDKIQMILLAVDSMCKCKGIVDEILRERPGVAQANLRNFKYALFEKALGFVEEFNTIVRVLVMKQLNVDIATTFSDNGIRYSNLFHSILGKL
ncbi:hypothetical protein Btru_077886 [Bulinus truncatus]|nr:hypothetical protein Btru_077886 [Bulinus truncatus]